MDQSLVVKPKHRLLLVKNHLNLSRVNLHDRSVDSTRSGHSWRTTTLADEYKRIYIYRLHLRRSWPSVTRSFTRNKEKNCFISRVMRLISAKNLLYTNIDTLSRLHTEWEGRMRRSKVMLCYHVTSSSNVLYKHTLVSFSSASRAAPYYPQSPAVWLRCEL